MQIFCTCAHEYTYQNHSYIFKFAYTYIIFILEIFLWCICIHIYIYNIKFPLLSWCLALSYSDFNMVLVWNFGLHAIDCLKAFWRLRWCSSSSQAHWEKRYSFPHQHDPWCPSSSWVMCIDVTSKEISLIPLNQEPTCNVNFTTAQTLCRLCAPL